MISRDFQAIFIMAVCAISSVQVWAQGAPPSITVQSNAPSLSFTYLHREHDQFIYEIRNNSNRAVRAFNLNLVFSDPTVHGGMVRVANRRSPMLEPGATFLYAPIPDPRGGAVTAMLLTAAVFDNDTFEGDEVTAVKISAKEIGEDGQYDRIERIVQPILADTQSDDGAKISQIRTRVGQLSEEPDVPTFERYARMFPTFADVARPARSKYYYELKEGFVWQKGFVLQKLKQFMCGDYPAGTSLEEWWKATRKNQQYAVSACAKE